MRPILQALLVADHVYVDKATNKKVVAGIFHNIQFIRSEGEGTESEEADVEKEKKFQVPQTGHRAGSPFCYISLTEIRGSQQFTLRFVYLNEDKPIFHTNFTVESNDPLQTVEVVIALPVLPINESGTYALELLCNEEPLGSHRIGAQEAKKNNG